MYYVPNTYVDGHKPYTKLPTITQIRSKMRLTQINCINIPGTSWLSPVFTHLKYCHDGKIQLPKIHLSVPHYTLIPHTYFLFAKGTQWYLRANTASELCCTPSHIVKINNRRHVRGIDIHPHRS